MREVLLPEANRRAWDEVPVEVQKRLKIHWVKNVEDMMGVYSNKMPDFHL